MVLRALSFAKSSRGTEVREALTNSLDDAYALEPSVFVVAGELRPSFDELELLRATVLVGSSIAGTDKRMLAALAVAEEALGARLTPPSETLLNLTRAIESASVSLPVAPDFVAGHATRVVLEGRKYKRRTLLGSPRLRTELVMPGGETFVLYLPDAVADALPLLSSFPTVIACDVRPKEDHAEADDLALFALAVGRMLAARAVPAPTAG